MIPKLIRLFRCSVTHVMHLGHVPEEYYESLDFPGPPIPPAVFARGASINGLQDVLNV